MKTWTDSENREWNIALTIADCRAIRATVKVELGDATKAGEVANLINHAEKLGETLWQLSKGQAEPLGISQDEFYRGLNGDSLQAGWKAIVEAFIDFCPPSVRETVRNAFVQFDDTMALTAKAVKASLADPAYAAELDAQITSIVQESFRQTLENFATA